MVSFVLVDSNLIFEELAKDYGQYCTGYYFPKLARFGQRKQVCLQWIPTHVSVPGNEVADELAGRGCNLPNPSSSVLSHSENHYFHIVKMNLTWRNPPVHHWYAAKSPGLCLQCRRSRVPP
ncbi:RNase H domain-containing protein [Trichonephila clavipes]|nr:RNase H domain-containing protein [Trichonephila clavipes]